MIVEVLRAVKAALEHSTYGVQAQVDALTLDGVSDAKPVVGTVDLEVDDIDAALKRFADQGAGMRVGVGDNITYDAIGNVEPSRITTVPIVIEYIVSNAIANTARAQGFYMCEAIVACLSQWLLQENNRVRNGVNIRNITNVVQQLTAFEETDVSQLCAVKIDVEAKYTNSGA